MCNTLRGGFVPGINEPVPAFDKHTQPIENDLRRIRGRIFNPAALCQSYGCHTGESMSSVWKKTFRIPLIGAKGKTDYAVVGEGRLPTVSGSWVR